jgi:nitrogen-specific signal transduction histidine kinase
MEAAWQTKRFGKRSTPIFTTKPVGQGSGLGQVQRFVRESGSVIEIKFEVGIGTAVRMLLPVSRPSEGDSATCPI